MINQWIGDLRITNFLGMRAGFEIYRAIDPGPPETRYLVRRVSCSEVSSAEVEKHFATLARELALLDHPKILPLRRVLLHEDSVFLVSEYLHGNSLSALHAEKGIHPIPHAMGLFKQMSEAVSAAHQQGVLHGALSLDNALYAVEKYLKVDGFGLGPVLNRLGLKAGPVDPGNVAPELKDGAEPSVAAEVFALGAMLIHLLTGAAADPSHNGSRSLVDQLKTRRQELPQRLLDLVDRATAFDPAERFRSAEAMLSLAMDRSNKILGGSASASNGAGLVQIGSRRAAASALDAQPAEVVPAEEPEKDLGDLPTLIPISGGPFLKGGDTRPNEGPVEQCDLPEFRISQYPTTNRQYGRFCEESGRARPEDPPEWGQYFVDYPDHPVVNVTWMDAAAYCRWLSETLGTEIRLPMEAEWEKAARGGLEGKQYPWGDDEPDGRAHFGGRAYAWELGMIGPQTRRVGCYPSNGFNLYDMAGNVWEWCTDWYTPYGEPQPRAGIFRIARGGSWSVTEDSLRCAFRMCFYRTARDFFIGFRCVQPGAATAS